MNKRKESFLTAAATVTVSRTMTIHYNIFKSLKFVDRHYRQCCQQRVPSLSLLTMARHARHNRTSQNLPAAEFPVVVGFNKPLP